MCIDPLRITHQIVGNVGVDDGNVLAGNGGRILCSQLGNDLLHDLYGQLTSVIQSGARGDLGLLAVCTDLGAVADVSAGVQNVTDNGVHSCAALTAEQLQCFYDHVVNGGQFQHIRHGDVVAVLLYGCGDGGDFQSLAIGGNTFNQRSHGLGQGRELTEFNGLTAVLGDRTLLTELVMHQSRCCLIDQGHIVKGLHFGTQSCSAGGLQLVGEQLQVQNHDAHQAHDPVDKLSHKFFLLSYGEIRVRFFLPLLHVLQPRPGRLWSIWKGRSSR